MKSFDAEEVGVKLDDHSPHRRLGREANVLIWREEQQRAGCKGMPGSIRPELAAAGFNPINGEVVRPRWLGRLGIDGKSRQADGFRPFSRVVEKLVCGGPTHRVIVAVRGPTY